MKRLILAPNKIFGLIIASAFLCLAVLAFNAASYLNAGIYLLSVIFFLYAIFYKEDGLFKLEIGGGKNKIF